jgi:hypothetical protein
MRGSGGAIVIVIVFRREFSRFTGRAFFDAELA